MLEIDPRHPFESGLEARPRRRSVFLGYRHTENASVQKLGDGAWKSISAIGNPDRRYYDPSTEQAAFFGVMNEGPEAPVVTVRIRVENGKRTASRARN